MKNRKFSLKIAALLLACGSFGFVSSFLKPDLVYAMEGGFKGNVSKKGSGENDVGLEFVVFNECSEKPVSQWRGYDYLRSCYPLREASNFVGLEQIAKLYGFKVHPKGVNIVLWALFSSVIDGNYVCNRRQLFADRIFFDGGCGVEHILTTINYVFKELSDYFKLKDSTEDGEENLELRNRVSYLKEDIKMLLEGVYRCFIKIQKEYDKLLEEQKERFNEMYIKRIEESIEKYGIVNEEEERNKVNEELGDEIFDFVVIANMFVNKIRNLLTEDTTPSLADLCVDSESLKKTNPNRVGLFKNLFGKEDADRIKLSMECILKNFVVRSIDGCPSVGDSKLFCDVK